MNTTGLLLLTDSPGHRGEQLGSCQGALLKARSTEFRALCVRNKLDALQVPDAARLLSTSINVINQEWLAEHRTLAVAAQVPAASLLAMSYPPEGVQEFFLPKRNNDQTAFAATAFAAPSGLEAARAPRGVLMENVDGPRTPHCVISRSASPGSTAYVALCEAGDVGVRSFLNDAGLAGTFHYGPPVDDAMRVQLPPAVILRQICERGLSCAHAFSEFEKIFKRVLPGTPCGRGVVFLFADKSGETLLIEMGGARYDHFRAAKNSVTTTNKFQLTHQTRTTHIEPFRQSYLRGKLSAEPLDLARCLVLSRLDKRNGTEKGVCDADTRASFIAVTGSDGFRPFALVTLGTPLYNIPILCIPGFGVPVGLVDGTAWTNAIHEVDPNGQRTERRTALEAELLQRIETLPGASPADCIALIKDSWLRREALNTFSPPVLTQES